MTKSIEKQNAGTIVPFDYGDDGGKGFENQTKADTSIPFIVLCQPMSPMVQAEKARPGDYWNTVTEQVWSRETGILMAFGTTKHCFAEWTPRDKGGGFHGHHEIDSAVVQNAIKASAKFGKYKTDDGNDLTETFYGYGAVCSEDGMAESMAIMAFWSTKIRAYKAWNTRIRTFNQQHRNQIPLFANLVRITSTVMKNEKGTFYIPVLSSGDPRGLKESLLAPDDDRYIMAKACGMLVNSGDAEVKYDKSRDGGDEEAGDGKTPF